MVEFILLCIPSLIYVAVQSRRKDQTLQFALRRVGASWGSAAAYGRAGLCLVPWLLSGWLLLGLIPEEVLSGPDLLIVRYTSVAVVIGAILRAIGEEVFFRGLLAGVLIRRLGFWWGNLLQTAIFLIPHLPLLFLDIRLWPFIPTQFIAGYLFGYLRHRSGTFVPVAIVHVVVNLSAGLIAL